MGSSSLQVFSRVSRSVAHCPMQKTNSLYEFTEGFFCLQDPDKESKKQKKKTEEKHHHILDLLKTSNIRNITLIVCLVW